MADRNKAETQLQIATDNSMPEGASFDKIRESKQIGTRDELVFKK
jgi:hypothetical protein